MIRHATVLVALAALAACSNAGVVDQPPALNEVPGGPFAIQTDASSYELDSRSDGVAATIGFVFTNRAGVRVYVVNCNRMAPPGLEKLVDGEWILAWSAITPACLSAPIVIDPREEYSSRLHFFAGNPTGNTYPKFETPGIAGTYRLVWYNVLTSYDDRAWPFGPPLPKEQRVSNPFTLTSP